MVYYLKKKIYYVNIFKFFERILYIYYKTYSIFDIYKRKYIFVCNKFLMQHTKNNLNMYSFEKSNYNG